MGGKILEKQSPLCRPRPLSLGQSSLLAIGKRIFKALQNPGFHSDPGTPDLLWLVGCKLKVTGDDK